MEMSPAELEDIYFACKTGKALLAQKETQALVFLMQFRGQSIVPLLDLDRRRIITFLPGDYFVKGQRLEYNKANHSVKQKASHAKFDRGSPYRRKRISVRQALEEQ